MKAQFYILLFTVLFLNLPVSDLTAQDTLSVTGKEQKVFKADPMRATMLAVALPGLGQIYNRKFWKVPFVYAASAAPSLQ